MAIKTSESQNSENFDDSQSSKTLKSKDSDSYQEFKIPDILKIERRKILKKWQKFQ